MSKESIAEFEPGVSRVLTSKGETRAFYNKIAKVYDLLAEHSEMPMREAGLKKLAVSSGERVLEIGFGTGHCLIELAKAVGPRGRIFGIDLSDRMLELAEDLVRSEGFTERIELRSGDAVTLPYESGSLDGVFMSFTLELFDTPEIPRVLAECRRVLHPSGRIVVVAVSKEGKQGILMEAYEWTHRHFPNLLDCRPIFARRALESAGFIIREVELQHMWVPVEIVLAATPI